MPPTIPFAEPPWLNGLPSPYYKPSHHRLQRACNAFISTHLTAHALEWETSETVPAHVWGTFAAGNMLLGSLPAPLPVAWLRKVGVTHMPGDVLVEEWDALHSLIYTDEMGRSGLAGPCGSLTAGMAFGVPPIIKYGSRELQERFLPDLLLGKKRSCIAITEPR
jgi:acyl-CoA dehydrogenase